MKGTTNIIGSLGAKNSGVPGIYQQVTNGELIGLNVSGIELPQNLVLVSFFVEKRVNASGIASELRNIGSQYNYFGYPVARVLAVGELDSTLKVSVGDWVMLKDQTLCMPVMSAQGGAWVNGGGKLSTNMKPSEETMDEVKKGVQLPLDKNYPPVMVNPFCDPDMDRSHPSRNTRIMPINKFVKINIHEFFDSSGNPVVPFSIPSSPAGKSVDKKKGS